MAEFYDLRGLNCPLPVLKTRKKMRSMAAGEVLEIETTDPLATIDIPHFCRSEGHELITSEKVDGGHRFAIRCGEPSAAD